jgi:hypothetical protein
MSYTTTKTITMTIGFTIYTATLSSRMSEGDDIYNALRATFNGILHPGAHIIVVYYPTGNEKIRLSYATLKEGVAYRVEPATERLQGASTSSVGTLRTRVDIEQILKNWSLEDPSQILPASIAPPEEASSWARKMARTLRSMSGRYKASHQTAVWYLEQEVTARRGRGDDGVEHLTAGDVQRATKNMVEYMAQEATELIKDEQANEVFAGGMAQAVEEAEEEEPGAAGWQYEEGGQFQIAMHFRK